MSHEPLSGMAEDLRVRAADLAGPLSADARRSATIAQERAILRMLGVDGLDRAGRPLATSVAEIYCGTDRGRLSGGLLLPFSVALIEYDLPPRELALDVASGVVDLALEAELLQRPERLAPARAHASRSLATALARVDANKTATRELREVLGLPSEPWLGAVLQAAAVGPAVDEVGELVRAGIDVVAVQVPASWEFAQAQRLAVESPGEEGKRRRLLRRKPQASRRMDSDPVPAGSQRGLASLRGAADAAAAERRCYAALMTATSAFAAPEQAVVAAFERIDLVEADPIREIVEDSVDPDRALADHAFAHRLHARAGTYVVSGPGPLAMGADVASGRPADEATNAGRALALQALGVQIALADGLPADRLLAGTVPIWVAEAGKPRSILVAAWLRHLVFPDLRLAIHEPPSDGPDGSRIPALIAALTGAPAALVVSERSARVATESAAVRRRAAETAAALRSALSASLQNDSEALARRALEAARSSLERFAAEGWESLLGPSAAGHEPARYGQAAVVPRSSEATSSAGLLKGLL